MIKKLALALMIAVGLTGPAQAYLIDPLHIGNWEGGAYYNDGNRLFSHCAVGTGYRNGIDVALGWGPGGLTIGFIDERWRAFAVGSQTNIRIQIDNRWDSQGSANVIGPGQLVTTMGSQPRAVTAMRRGRQLSATIGKETLVFDLTSTNAAIDALASCYRRHNR